MTKFADNKIEMIFRFYPAALRPQMLALRELIFETVERLNLPEALEETIKWGEPSYTTANGSTVRIDWKEKDPDHYRVFFHCQTSLVETFRVIYPNEFEFEGNRAIRIGVDDKPKLKQLGHCIELALTYHDVKNLPLLGARS